MKKRCEPCPYRCHMTIEDCGVVFSIGAMVIGVTGVIGLLISVWG